MRVVAFMNQKGGVAKTTTAVNVAYALAQLQRRVLVIDLDPQSHLTMHLGVEPTSQKGIYGVLTGQLPIEKVLVKVAPKLYCAPAHIDLAATEVELAGMPDRERVIAKQLPKLARYFDFVMFDCPPSLGVLTLNALAAATDVMIPLQTHFFALQGVGKLLETVTLVRDRINPKLSVCGFVLCMYDSGTKLAAEVESDLQQFVDGSRDQPVAWKDAVLFRTKIRRNIKLAESPSHGQSIFQYAPESNGAADYKLLATELAMLIAGRWPEFVARAPKQQPTEQLSVPMENAEGVTIGLDEPAALAG